MVKNIGINDIKVIDNRLVSKDCYNCIHADYKNMVTKEFITFMCDKHAFSDCSILCINKR